MGFHADERRVLLALPGIGPGVLQRLEQAGIDSLDALYTVGADAVVLQVCKTLGHGAWRNRHRALQRAVALVPSNGGAPEGAGPDRCRCRPNR